MDWKELLIPSLMSMPDKVFDLSKIPEGYQLDCLIENDFWVCHNYKPNGWMDFAFLAFAYSDIDYKNTCAEIMMLGGGPTGALRECRHTYWGDKDGYIFYPKARHIRAALDWLEKFYDLD